MYSLIKINHSNDKFYIKVGDFYVAKTFWADDGTWHSVVEDEHGDVVMRYCSTNRKKSVEGIIRQMIYSCYNNALDGKNKKEG